MIDNTAPSIIAPADIVKPSTTLPVPLSGIALGSPIVADNCGIAGMTNNAPLNFPAGTTIVTWTVTDVHGNASSATQKVRIIPAAAINVLAALHVVGSGTNPGASKTAIVLNLKVFDAAIVGSPGPSDFGATWSSGAGLTSPEITVSGPTAVSFGGGAANLYTVLVPSTDPANADIASGNYLVIGQASVGSATVYVGNSPGLLATAAASQQYLQVLQNGNGKVLPAKTTAVPGSLLLITEPEYLEFTSTQELLPIVYESVEGQWSAVVQADPPQGFVSNPGALQASLTDSQIQAVQFTINDVGSSWTSTKLTHHLRHNGRDITVTNETKMFNKKH